MHRRIAAATAIVMTSVLLSRILGFFRDWAVAHQMGANACHGRLLHGVYASRFPELSDRWRIAERHVSFRYSRSMCRRARGRRLARLFDDRHGDGVVLVALVVLGEIFAAPLVK